MAGEDVQTPLGRILPARGAKLKMHTAPSGIVSWTESDIEENTYLATPTARDSSINNELSSSNLAPSLLEDFSSAILPSSPSLLPTSSAIPSLPKDKKTLALPTSPPSCSTSPAAPSIKTSKFLGLPTETRARIYEYCFFNERVLYEYHNKLINAKYISCKVSEVYMKTWAITTYRPIAILRTSRQCYREAKVAFDHMVEFRIVASRYESVVPFIGLPQVPVSQGLDCASRLKVLTIDLLHEFRASLDEHGFTLADIENSAEAQQKVFGDMLLKSKNGDEAGEWLHQMRKHGSGRRSDIKLLFKHSTLNCRAATLKVTVDHYTFHVPQDLNNPRLRPYR